MRTLIAVSLLLCFVTITNAQVTDTIYVQSEGVRIHTVLTKPGNKTNTPLAIIIAGSGPTDLNGNQARVQNNSLRYLSEALVKNNIATVRFDKRGIAKSTIPGLKEADLTFEQYADDVVSLIKYFRDMGFKKIYIVGHSEGSLVGMMALQKMKTKGFISVAGMGNSPDSVLKKQLAPKLPPELYKQCVTIIDSLKMGSRVKNFPLQLVSLFRPSVQPYMISWFKYDPAKLIGKLDCPVMILQGDKDIQVDPEEAKILKAASPKGEMVVIKNMNHIFKIIQGDMQENMASYTNPELPVSQDLVDSIVGFINNK